MYCLLCSCSLCYLKIKGKTSGKRSHPRCLSTDKWMAVMCFIHSYTQWNWLCFIYSCTQWNLFSCKEKLNYENFRKMDRPGKYTEIIQTQKDNSNTFSLFLLPSFIPECLPPPPLPVFWERVSLCCLDLPRTHYIDQASSKLMDMPASGSQRLRLKVCTSAPTSYVFSHPCILASNPKALYLLDLECV